MKNKKNIRTIIQSVLFLSIIGMFTCCSNWTDQENVDVKDMDIQSVDNALYQQYLKSLRDYKKTSHQILFAWFDNTDKRSQSRAGRLEALPDSVDVVTLIDADNLTPLELKDIAMLKKDKGFKIIYTIDCEAIAKKINDKIAAAQEAAEEAETEPEEIDFLADFTTQIDSTLKLMAKYKYDGISLYYAGRARDNMSQEEVESMEALQNMIFDKMDQLMTTTPGLYVFDGNPANIIKKEVLEKFKYIVLRNFKATDIFGFEYSIITSLVPGVPTDRIIVSTSAVSTDPGDTSSGWMVVGGKNLNSIVEVARWVCTEGSFHKAGMGIYRINDDYYYQDQDYKHVREAISIMNPSPKN